MCYICVCVSVCWCTVSHVGAAEHAASSQAKPRSLRARKWFGRSRPPSRSWSWPRPFPLKPGKQLQSRVESPASSFPGQPRRLPVVSANRSFSLQGAGQSVAAPLVAVREAAWSACGPRTARGWSAAGGCVCAGDVSARVLMPVSTCPHEGVCVHVPVCVYGCVHQCVLVCKCGRVVH